ncbi:ribosome assembly RNA-binding protein YhbY [Salinicoccus kekensis]|uniref:RNA-binding protein n=1 Tax=Salinicoccus kekensis TaxID=714307 RepID=A0A285UAP9_9STAP|nr:ribosome assembly RNA-binding protein YhbY [Salinicoccus kekensis]SOC38498.1 RNA-binding protein [Salinicoccus kekensis]
MTTLSSKNIKQLKKASHNLNPIFQVGKNGVTDNFIEQINDVLEKRELLKISVLQNCLEDKEDIAKTVSEATDSNVVSIIGNTIILYRESNTNKKIELS